MLLKDLADYLTNQSLGTQGTNLWTGILLPDDPVSPATVVTALFEYGGRPNEPNLGKTTINLEYPFVQVVCRGLKNDYDGPRLRAQQIVTAFALIANQTLPGSSSGVSYKAIVAKNPPAFLRRDEEFRVEISCNFEILKGYSTS